MNERYFIVGPDDSGTMVFATHGYFSTRQAAESYARTISQRHPMVVMATDEFYKRDGVQACGG